MTLFLLNCRPHYTIHHDDQIYAVKGFEEKDSSSVIAQYLRPFRDSLSRTMNHIIGEAGGDFKKEKGGGSLGMLVIEAMNDELFQSRRNLWEDSNGSVPLTITNPGGLRISQISKGKITLEKAFELLPFENELTLIEVNGKTLKQLAKLIQESGGWPNNARLTGDSVNEMKVTQVQVDPVTGKMKRIVTAHRSRIIDEKVYRLLTNDYVAGGGDNCSFLKNCPRKMTGITLREAFIHYLGNHPVVSPND